MIRPDHDESIKFFTGTEVEHTPAYGKKTLFVIGVQDVVVDIGRSIGMAGGVYGCRMTGGGFGGCAVALVQTSKVAEIAARIASEYEARTKIKPTLFLSRPASGAVIL